MGDGMSIQHVAAVLDARDERLAGCRKLVLIALANRTDQYGKCWPSQDLVAGECGISTRSLSEHLKGLEDDGFIVRDTQHLGQGRGSRTTYTLVLVSLKVAPEEIAPAKFAPEENVVCTGSTPRVTNLQEPTLDDDDSASAEIGFEEKCREWADGALGPHAGGLEKLERLLSLSSDEACTEADVERGIKHAIRWLRKNEQKANSFGYFEGAVVAARDQRLKPVTPSERKSIKRVEQSKSDELDRMLAKGRG